MNALKKLELKATEFVANSPGPIYNTARTIQNIFDSRKIKNAVKSGTPLVLVYQYGRVASTSVYASVLAANIELPTFHVHTISSKRASEWVNRAKKNGEQINRNFIVGKILGDTISKQGDTPYPKPWKIISIFREPISLMLSLHFLNPEGKFLEVLEKYSETDKTKVIDYFVELFDNDNPSNWALSNWYDDVFPEETGINVYDYEFNSDQGYQIIRNERFDTLLLRFEDLANSFKVGGAELFGLDQERFNLLHSHIHKNDKYHEVHNYVKNNLVLSKETCDKLYSTKFMKHFYSDDFIEKLTNKWTGAR